MSRIHYPPIIEQLIEEFKHLPGIGIRSAERMAVWMIQHPRANAQSLAQTLLETQEVVSLCSTCGFFMESQTCEACLDETRDDKTICVIEQPTDVLPLERAGVFTGRYHCLGGKLSPLDGVGPEDLRIQPLLHQVSDQTEVILALSSDVEGEATANYLSEILVPKGCKVSRIAQGLPAGGGLEQADDLTLIRALQGRR